MTGTPPRKPAAAEPNVGGTEGGSTKPTAAGLNLVGVASLSWIAAACAGAGNRRR
jgi:hypothetical protein